MSFSPSRRRFLLAGAAGGALLIGYGLFKPRDLLGDRSVLPVVGTEIALNAWLKIAADGRVTVAVPRAEMGQGIYTALPMLVAEELDLPWTNIAVEQAPIAEVYGNILALVDAAPFDREDQGWLPRTVRWTLARAARTLAVQVTGGSTSVRDAWLPMRTAGAAARAMLVSAAAARLGVAPADLTTADGSVTHAASGRSLAYGELAAEAAALAPPDVIELKDTGRTLHLGLPRPRLDVPDKTTGRALFGIDARGPGMLYAAIKASPVFGGRLATADVAAIRRASDVVEVVEVADALIVIATSYWRAQQALDQAVITFEGGEVEASNATILAAYGAALDAEDTFAYENTGDAQAALTGAGVIAAEYRVPLLAHACMEPMNCTARVGADNAEIWCGNQAPDLLRRLAADFLGLATERVTLHTPYLGGGFGRRAEADVMLRGLAAARSVPDRTVQLVYSRSEDLQQDTYRPPALSRFRALLDAQGHIQAWANEIASPSVSQAVIGRAFPHLPLGGPDRTNVEGAAFLPYSMAHRRIAHAAVSVPLPVGFWRSVGHSYNAFFTECFIDELAAAAGRDPLAFRLQHLDRHPRHRHVLELLAELGAWSSNLEPGRGRGLALHESFHSIVGQLAEVSIAQGRVQVHRVTCVIDCGLVVNPDIVMAQMESGIVFGLTAALYGDAPLDQGRINLSNFTDYRMLSLAETPHIETHVVQSGAEPGGVGEPGTPPIAPAVANAVSRLTGRRVRSLPIRL